MLKIKLNNQKECIYLSQREILFDTETTGFDPVSGDRIVEIGAVELIDLLPTGREFHSFVNPQRDIPFESTKVHGITNDMVKNAPIWDDISADFMDFVGDDSILVAHNAEFDMNFLNFQNAQIGKNTIGKDRVKDSLALAKKKFPGQANSLDALCRRFNIDLSVRSDRHGALLDSYLLADVWLELHGGRQQSMLFSDKKQKNTKTSLSSSSQKIYEIRNFPPLEEERKAHKEFIEKYIKDSSWYK